MSSWQLIFTDIGQVLMPRFRVRGIVFTNRQVGDGGSKRWAHTAEIPAETPLDLSDIRRRIYNELGVSLDAQAPISIAWTGLCPSCGLSPRVSRCAHCTSTGIISEWAVLDPRKESPSLRQVEDRHQYSRRLNSANTLRAWRSRHVIRERPTVYGQGLQSRAREWLLSIAQARGAVSSKKSDAPKAIASTIDSISAGILYLFDRYQWQPQGTAGPNAKSTAARLRYIKRLLDDARSAKVPLLKLIEAESAIRDVINSVRVNARKHKANRRHKEQQQ